MASDLAKRAALNNAAWCDAMARAHRRPGVFSPTIWSNRHAMPRFYPNLVTLEPATEPSTLLGHIRDLIDAGLPNGWSVKDSFCQLDLKSVGFTMLFEATWIHLPTPQSRSIAEKPDVVWRRIEMPEDLVEWEIAWAGGAPMNEPAIFLPPLLAERTHHVIAGYQNGRIVAGCIASEAADVMGITNLFLPNLDQQAYRSDCMAAAIQLSPALPLVSYDQEDECLAMQDVGFECLGPLRVFSFQAD
jgi:hypothetical protein